MRVSSQRSARPGVRTSTPPAGNSPGKSRTGLAAASSRSNQPLLTDMVLHRPFTILIALILVAGCASKSTTTEQALPAVQPRNTPPQPQQTSPHDRARIHTDLASGYYERGQMDVALDELKLSASLDPNYAQTYNIYGLVYAVLGEDRNAEQNFDRALQLAPNDSDIHHNWGWYLCQHKREREALGQFELAVRNPLYKTPEIALVNAGRCSQPFDEKAAESYYRRALAVQPGNPLASLGLAQIA